MTGPFTDFTADPFGLQAGQLNACQMMLRAVVAFFAGLTMIRIMGLRTLGKMSAFDQLTILIIGSILGRAVVTGMSFFGSLAATFVIIILGKILAWLTFKSKAMGKILKGDPILLIRDSEKQPDTLAKTLISDEDLKEALHSSINKDNLDNVHEAYLERSGEISFVEKTPKEKQP